MVLDVAAYNKDKVSDLSARVLPFFDPTQGRTQNINVLTNADFGNVRGIDMSLPATLSRYTIKRYLRGKLGYKGPVVSDDLLMGAIRQRYGVEEAAVLALQATVDVLLVSQNQGGYEQSAAERVVAAIHRAVKEGRLSPKALAGSLERVQKLRSRIAR